MNPLLVSAVVALVVALVVSLLTIKFSRPRGSLLSHHPYRRHCQDVDTEEECDGNDPIFTNPTSTKEMGPTKFMGI